MSLEIEFLDKIDSLKKITSRKLKKELLIQYLEDDIFREIIKLTLDKRNIYNINDIGNYKYTDNNSTLLNLIEYLKYLSNKNCNKKDKCELYKIACSNYELYKISQMILSKQLNCGIGIETINSIYPDLILAELPYMRCSTIKHLNNIKYPALAQLKLNGEFISIVIKDNTIQFKNRENRDLNFKNFFIDDIIKTHNIWKNDNYNNYIIIGEIISLNNNQYLNRSLSNGLMNKVLQGTINDEELATFKIGCWDIITYDEFYSKNNKKNNIIYEERFNKLKSWINLFNTVINKKFIDIVDTIIVNNENELYQYYNNIIEQKLEGVIVKNLNNIFGNKTATDQIKIKPVRETELRLIKWNYGKINHKYQYCLGSLSLQSDDGLINVDVGSGFDDNLRGFLGFDENNNLIKTMDKNMKHYWNSLLNSIIEVNYNELIQNEKNEYSLYLPIFSKVRIDKNKTDNLNDLLNR